MLSRPLSTVPPAVRSTQRVWRSRRRGISALEACLVVAAIAIACLAGVSLLGGSTASKLTQTAGDVANPSSLPQRFSAPAPAPINSENLRDGY